MSYWIDIRGSQRYQTTKCCGICSPLRSFVRLFVCSFVRSCSHRLILSTTATVIRSTGHRNVPFMARTRAYTNTCIHRVPQDNSVFRNACCVEYTTRQSHQANDSLPFRYCLRHRRCMARNDTLNVPTQDKHSNNAVSLLLPLLLRQWRRKEPCRLCPKVQYPHSCVTAIGIPQRCLVRCACRNRYTAYRIAGLCGGTIWRGTSDEKFLTPPWNSTGENQRNSQEYRDRTG